MSCGLPAPSFQSYEIEMDCSDDLSIAAVGACAALIVLSIRSISTLKDCGSIALLLPLNAALIGAGLRVINNLMPVNKRLNLLRLA